MIPKIDLKETVTIITDFIKTYKQNSGCTQIVLGLSGGLDSCVTAILCQQALGPKQVMCLFIPDNATPELDIKHQELIVKKFKLNHLLIPLNSTVEEIQKTMNIKQQKLTLSNIKARLRMILLYAYANEHNCLVCGTSNKSELLVGYFTKYGDGGADIQPLGDLYKTQLFQLAEYLSIPKEIISKPPTAGLWRGQTDEQELQIDYTTLDTILSGLEQRLSIQQIQSLSKASVADITRIKTTIQNTHHKRRLPLTPKISLRTTGVDWRQPIQKG
ncbi:MAG: NAD+ synthase [Thermoplasmatota archaeon]